MKKVKFIPRKVATPKELAERWDKKKIQIETLSNNIGKLRRHVSEDLKSDDEKKALTALAIALIDKTGERVGNEESASNGNFGITGLRKKHINIDGNTVALTYRGKSGVLHDTSFNSGVLAENLKKAIKNSKSSRVFETSDGFRIKNDGVNRYLSNYDVSAKDIRGFRSNDWIVKKLSREAIPQTKEQRQKTFSNVLKKVAEKIGHGKSTLRTHYMIPELETKYIDKGEIIDISSKESYEEGGRVKGKSQKEKNMSIINDGTKGGLLYGPTDKNDNPGIKAEVIGGDNVILGGGEVIINEEAAKKNCEILNEINTSTGGRPIDCNIIKIANISKMENTHTLEEFNRLINNLQNEAMVAVDEGDEAKLKRINELTEGVIVQRNSLYFNEGGSINSSLIAGDFILPKDHRPFMKVSSDGMGSSCASCKFLSKTGDNYICTNKYYKTWTGSPSLPNDVENYCSDWFEPKESSV